MKEESATPNNPIINCTVIASAAKQSVYQGDCFSRSSFAMTILLGMFTCVNPYFLVRKLTFTKNNLKIFASAVTPPTSFLRR